MTVAIVLDPAYLELEQLAEQMPIWAVDSALNRGVAERLWLTQGVADAFQGITLFKVSDERDAEVNCANIIGEVDLQHGVYSSGSTIATLKVIGTKPSNKLREELRAYGFEDFEPTLDGFMAHAE